MAIEQSTLLADFARTCQAAARAVSLYPGTHPAIGSSLTRLVASAGRLARQGPVELAVHRELLAIDGRSPLRPDSCIGELGGIYPEGNLVLLDSGEIAVVLKADAPDPCRPRVRILFTSEGKPIPEPVELDLWESEGPQSRSIQAPVDPADYGIDPLTQL